MNFTVDVAVDRLVNGAAYCWIQISMTAKIRIARDPIKASFATRESAANRAHKAVRTIAAAGGS